VTVAVHTASLPGLEPDEPQAVAPEAAQPEAVESEPDEPQAVAPETAEPEPVESEAVAPEAVAPEAVEPEPRAAGSVVVGGAPTLDGPPVLTLDVLPWPALLLHHGIVREVNARFEDEVGLAAADVADLPVDELFEPSCHEHLADALELVRGERVVRVPVDFGAWHEHRRVVLVLRRLADGWVIAGVDPALTDPSGLGRGADDVLPTPAELARLRHLALHDSLTGLANRVALADRLDQALARHRRTGDGVGLLFCDLDGFKSVNDRFGHDAGDGVLTEIAGRIVECTRDADTVARYGGDEFVVLVEGVHDREALEVLARRIAEAVVDPVAVGGSVVRVGASLGIAMAGDDGAEPEVVLARADAAMYRTKLARRAAGAA
jgi:diguanylate cyclase (GGDEF)-like protein